jgi:hypothetical protein
MENNFSKTFWPTVKSLLIVMNYKDDNYMSKFRLSLDKIMNNSNVERLLIVVNIPKDIDKNTLSPHFVIFYLSPKDFNFFGKLKDVQLEAELNSDFNALICFGDLKKRTMKLLKNSDIKKRILVNANDPGFDLYLNSENQNPEELLSFITKTLEKISFND